MPVYTDEELASFEELDEENQYEDDSYFDEE